MSYQFIKDNRCSFPVMKMCHALAIHPSGFYRWLNSPVSSRKFENICLRQRICELYNEHRGMAGSPMITADLNAEPEYSNVSKNRVARHMRDMGLRCKATKKFVVTTDSKHSEPVAPNILDRNFTVPGPNRVWVSDITYLKVGRKWYYLSVFIDLFSRIVVGWDLSCSLARHSTIKAFKKGLMRRRPIKGLMVHSDRGVQYVSSDFRLLLEKHGYIQSMSRKGNCWDNAVAESFFHTMKTQLTHHVRFKDKAEAERTLFLYIEVYYNRRRRHSANGYLSPANFEERNNKMKLAA